MYVYVYVYVYVYICMKLNHFAVYQKLTLYINRTSVKKKKNNKLK